MSLEIVQPEQMEPDGERVTCAAIAWALATGDLKMCGNQTTGF